MKKNMLLHNTVRSVKKYPGRFIAIMAIIAISCAFYAGVKAAPADLKRSGWEYFENYALADVQIKSTLGFDGSELDSLLDSEYFDTGYAGYSADLLMDSESGQAAVKVISCSEEQPLNKLHITEGRLPESSGECVVDSHFRNRSAYALGDKITFSADGDEDIADYLDKTEYTVVGIADSPLYVSFDRGSTTIGTGTLSGFVYISEEDFAYDVYTDIYLSVTGAMDSSVAPFSDEYMDIVNAAEDYAEEMSASLLNIRADDIRAEAEKEIGEARRELEDGESKYRDGKEEYDKGLKEYNDSFKELSEQRSSLDDAQKELDDGAAELAENEERLTELSVTCMQIDDLLKIYEKAYIKVLPDELLEQTRQIQQIYDENDIDAEISDLLAVYIITNPQKDVQSKAASKAAISAVNEQVRAAAAGALEQIEQQRAVVEETGKTLAENYETIEEYENELKDAKHELDDAKKKLDEAQAEIDEANEKIADAEKELEDTLSDGEWYIWNRDEFDPGCMGYGADADRVDSIAAVFPLFFILVAALVCCTTMSRMVEEQRGEAGTLRALGFGTGMIIMQYVLYAAIASVVGSIIGTALGFALFPNVIFYCYTTMYNFPDFHAPFMPGFALACMGVSLLCTTLSAVYTCVKELTDVPAMLIRPKPPKNGKRIFLEHITFIWKRMSFSFKVTFRNLLRYKSRFLMTVISICGCTALMLTGFGLKEAIACIADKQYDEIFLYDALAVLSGDADEADLDEIENTINSDSRIVSHMSVIQETKDVFSESENMECYILSLEDTSHLDEYIVLRDRKSGSHICPEDGSVVITEKLGKMLNVSAGDSITVEGASKTVTVSAVAENYTFHYVYMTKATYESLFGETDNNMIMINTDSTPESEVRDEISSELVSCGGIISASFMYDGTDSFRKLVSSLNIIVIVIIAFAGALALVILFNLANININERMGELATIKVLGFFDGEVGAYVYRENTVSSLIGMIFGLVVGIFLERFVVSKAEVDEVMFSPEIPWFCFVLAAAVMLIFTVFVNFLLYFRLKKIDMTTSLKAIE